MKRNTRVVTLLKNYVDKKSKKVIESRSEMQHRFDYLDWGDQKKILSAFLDAGKSDREWAYLKLYTFWDGSFLSRIKFLWEQYHEEKCAWLVVRNFPQDYLLAHLDELSTGRNYYFICLRMKGCVDFKMDKSLLTLCDYLSVLMVWEESITDEESEEILKEGMHSIFIEDGSWEVFPIERGCALNASHFIEIYKLLVRLKQLGKKNVLERFEEWNTQIQNEIYRSTAFQQLNEAPLKDKVYQSQRITIAVDYYRKALLPESEEDNVMRQMKRHHSAFNLLVDTLDLQ